MLFTYWLGKALLEEAGQSVVEMSSNTLQIVISVRIELLTIENVFICQSARKQHGVLDMHILISSSMN